MRKMACDRKPKRRHKRHWAAGAKCWEAVEGFYYDGVQSGRCWIVNSDGVMKCVHPDKTRDEAWVFLFADEMPVSAYPGLEDLKDPD
jgi:hypothetical protein